MIIILTKWIEEVTGKSVLESVSLKGGISSHMTKYILQDGETVVSRHITDMDWLREEPDLIVHEHQSLLAAEKSGAPTPRVISATSGDIHATLMTGLAGSVRLDLDDFPTSMNQLAHALHRIHQTPVPSNFHWRYASYVDINDVKIPHWTTQQQAWSTAIEFIKCNNPEFKPVFIHRDYHPTNILWEDTKLSGVVDWINACRGPALVDVAHCRMNLVMLYGVEVADEFLAEYLNVSSEAYLPYWDIFGFFDFVDEQLDIYDGWPVLGKRDLTQQLLRQRADEYILNLCSKINVL